jgi:hypothetical protein
MRIARVLAVTTLVLGGFAACNDHNPKVVFTTDAGIDGKTEAGALQDTVAGRDLGADPDGPTVAEVAAQGADAPLAAEVAPDGNRGIDASSALDVSVDANVTIDGATSVDGSGPAVDGVGGSAIDVGIDSSATIDGGKAGG